MDRMTNAENAALTRLFAAADEESPMGHRISHFLLAWWNPAVHGRFDFADATMVGIDSRKDMAVVFAAALRLGDGPGIYSQRGAFRRLSRVWLGGDPSATSLFDDAIDNDVQAQPPADPVAENAPALR